MDAIITAATVMAMYFNSLGSENSRYLYNADIQDGKVASINVYDNSEKYLSQKLQYRFLYDSDNRLVSKEALEWNSSSRRWQPSYRLNYTYDAAGYTLELQRWDSKASAYAKAEEKTEYRMVMGNVAAVNTYRWCDKSKGYELADNMLVMQPHSDWYIAQDVTVK